MHAFLFIFEGFNSALEVSNSSVNFNSLSSFSSISARRAFVDLHLGQPWLSSSKTSSSVCELPSRLRFIFLSLRASYQCNLGSTCWSSLWEFFLCLFFQGTSVYPSSHQPIFANLSTNGRRRATLWINYH